MPFIKKRLSLKTALRAKNPDYIRENKAKLNKVVQDATKDLVKRKSRCFGRGDIKKVWDPETRLRKKMIVTDSQGNPVREIEYNHQGNITAQAFKKKTKQ